MKKTFFISFAILFCSFTCAAQTKDNFLEINSPKIIVFTILRPEADSTGFFQTKEIQIKRLKGRLNFIKFTSGGTETNVSVIDSVRAAQYIDIKYCPSEKNLNFNSTENCLMDITEWQPSTYYVNYRSCNFFGGYVLRITE